MKKPLLLISLSLSLSLFLIPSFVHAQDISINEDGIKIADDIIAGKTARIYATVENHSDKDLTGTVKFYDETEQAFIGDDQPVSVIAGKTDDVFVDINSELVGEHSIAVRIIPWEEEGDMPENNKAVKTLYVDLDSDNDGIGNRKDNDDDNDGVIDSEDAFPLSPYESKDADGDGIGDNGDTDDDNDNVPDAQDAFPLDPAESADTDGDGVGDNTDVFPDDPTETQDSDGDGIGDNSDPNKYNHGPIPSIETEKDHAVTGEEITFNAIKSKDPDGRIVSYEWDFGNGVKKEGVLVEHTFKKPGKHAVILKTTDDKGESKEETLIIEVTYKWQFITLIAVTFLLLVFVMGYKTVIKKLKKREQRIKKEMEVIKKSLSGQKKEISAGKRKKHLPKKSG